MIKNDEVNVESMHVFIYQFIELCRLSSKMNLNVKIGSIEYKQHTLYGNIVD